jgi:L,D-peptidoglycan transpeptidase YkuD (ErfK/YbiS/YcfS/YnhG family)
MDLKPGGLVMLDEFATNMVFLLLFPVLASCAYAEDLTHPRPLWNSLQAIVVTATGWSSAQASLQGYERSHPDRPWRAVGKKIPAAIGRHGLAWGTGLHPSASPKDPVKREGDGRAPAGIFRLGMAFGYADLKAMSWVRLPYRQATPDLLCIDDPSSSFYNRIVDKRQGKTVWKSYEDMLRPDGQYRLGIVVEHNADPVVPGNGSCIFLHIWAGPGVGTSGCTAMAEEDLAALLRWLSPRANPVLVQLPEFVYSRHRKAWGLP